MKKDSVRLTALSAFRDEVSAFSQRFVDLHFRSHDPKRGHVERQGKWANDARYNASVALMALPCYLFLLLDSPLGVKPRALISLAKNKLEKMGLVDFAKASSLFADELLRSLSSTGLSSQLLENDSFFKRLLFRELRFLVQEHASEQFGDVLQYVFSVLVFLKKMPYRDDNFESTALRKWFEIEERLKELDMSVNPSYESLRVIISYLCGAQKLRLDIRDCHFGPGQVADLHNATFESKLYALFESTSWKTQRVLSSVLTTTGVVDKDRRDILPFVANSMEFSNDIGRFWSIARLKFVPKDVTTARSICMEPNDTMFIQQGLRSAVEFRMQMGPMRRFNDLKDQLVNQDLGVAASLRQDLDTIDLSSASDSVHQDWLDLFPSDWKTLLLGTRSTHVLVKDSEPLHRPIKFAPMGSALCFPIECIIFTALCIQSYCETAFGANSVFTSIDDVKTFVETMIEPIDSYLSREENGYAFHPISVYGDDLIVDSRTTESLYRLLESYGFSANRTKSFTGFSPVRETCGIYAYLGELFTPIRFRVRDETWNESLLALANRAGEFGYRGLRYAAIHSFLSERIDYIDEAEVQDGTIVFLSREDGRPICSL